MGKKVAIILVNYNTTFHTMNCIASLYRYCDRTLFDVILLDNGSVESPADVVLAKYPDVKFIDNGANLGFAEGNNVGLRYSTAQEYRYSLALNTDTEVNEDIIKKLSDHLDANPAAAAVQPAVHWMHNRKAIWNGNGHFNKFTGRTWSNTSPVKLKAGHAYVKADWLTGCCMMMRNETLSTSGLFDKEMFLYYEDVDLSFRMRNSGYEVHYLPSCKMYHEAGISAKAVKVQGEGTLNPVIHYYIARNHIWILRRYGSKLCYPVYFIYNGVYYAGVLTYLLIRRRSNKVKKLMEGLKEGMFAELSTSQV